jgi:uncharacterized membrane protein YqiK
MINIIFLSIFFILKYIKIKKNQIFIKNRLNHGDDFRLEECSLL